MRALAAVLAASLVLGGCVTVEYRAPAEPPAPVAAKASEEGLDEEIREGAIQVAVACLALYSYAQLSFERGGEFEAAAAMTPRIDFYASALTGLGYEGFDADLEARMEKAVSAISEAGLVASVGALADPCREMME